MAEKENVFHNAVFFNEYEKIAGKREPGAITGKPIELGGSVLRDISTSLGGTFVLEEVTKESKISSKNAIGFGLLEEEIRKKISSRINKNPLKDVFYVGVKNDNDEKNDNKNIISIKKNDVIIKPSKRWC